MQDNTWHRVVLRCVAFRCDLRLWKLCTFLSLTVKVTAEPCWASYSIA